VLSSAMPVSCFAYLVASSAFGSVGILGLPVHWESRALARLLGTPYAWRCFLFFFTGVVDLGFDLYLGSSCASVNACMPVWASAWLPLSVCVLDLERLQLVVHECCCHPRNTCAFGSVCMLGRPM